MRLRPTPKQELERVKELQEALESYIKGTCQVRELYCSFESFMPSYIFTITGNGIDYTRKFKDINIFDIDEDMLTDFIESYKQKVYNTFFKR